jgi:hypothetical protein
MDPDRHAPNASLSGKACSGQGPCTAWTSISHGRTRAGQARAKGGKARRRTGNASRGRRKPVKDARRPGKTRQRAEEVSATGVSRRGGRRAGRRLNHALRTVMRQAERELSRGAARRRSRSLKASAAIDSLRRRHAGSPKGGKITNYRSFIADANVKIFDAVLVVRQLTFFGKSARTKDFRHILNRHAQTAIPISRNDLRIVSVQRQIRFSLTA